jgi:hypothetical protein
MQMLVINILLDQVERELSINNQLQSKKQLIQFNFTSKFE